MIECSTAWHSRVVRPRASALLPLLLVLSCKPDGDEPCQPPDDPVPVTYSISLVGFPEVDGNTLISTNGLAFEGPCTVDAMDFAAGELTLSLACEHPAPSTPEGASVTITTAAAGLPAGVEIGDTLTFVASVLDFENLGGDASGPIFRGLEYAGPEIYELSDADGVVFAATVDYLGASFEPVLVNREYNCPDWVWCNGDIPGPIAAHVRASAGESEVDVHVGEVASIVSGELSWDLSLFSASLTNDCHDGEDGGFSVVRRPQ